MRILLLGDYSNVHATLADGLRELGHDVVVASDGDGWKSYPRDVDLRRKNTGLLATASFLWRLKKAFRTFRDFDVVQIINPIFLPLKAERIFPYYDALRRRNKSVFMAAFGTDYYYATTALDCRTFRYSDFNLGPTLRHSSLNDTWMNDWVRGEKGRLNRHIAADCNGIVAGLYEYYIPYESAFADKLAFIPFPVESRRTEVHHPSAEGKVRFFIGIQRARTAYKGTDIMLRALERIVSDYPDLCEMVKVESVPFPTYRKLLKDSDVILDQLYSYTPGMNALEAMAQGLVVVGGGEPENYEILGEEDLRPIVNVLPDEESVYQALKNILTHRDRLPRLSADSLAYIQRHHDKVLVARRYVDFWTSRM